MTYYVSDPVKEAGVKQSKKGKAGKIVAASFGAIVTFITFLILQGTQAGHVIGGYFGIFIVISSASIFPCYWVGRKIVNPMTKPMVPAMAVLAGEIAIYALLLINSGEFSYFMEVVTIIASLAWLLMRPGLGPVVLLAAYQIIVFLINADNFMSNEIGSFEHRISTFFLILSVAAITFLVVGLKHIRADKVAIQNTRLARFKNPSLH